MLAAPFAGRLIAVGRKNPLTEPISLFFIFAKSLKRPVTMNGCRNYKLVRFGWLVFRLIDDVNANFYLLTNSLSLCGCFFCRLEILDLLFNRCTFIFERIKFCLLLFRKHSVFSSVDDGLHLRRDISHPLL